MRPMTLRTLGLVAVLVLPFASTHAGAVVLPPGSVVEGRTIGDWGAEFWRWSFGFSAPNDPFNDPTGALANMNQTAPVFFVAGTTGGFSDRSFTVPAGHYLLIPLLVAEFSQLELGDFSLSEAQIRAEVNGLVDLIDELHASIDGVDVPDLFSHRSESAAFEYEAAPNNIIGVPPGNSGIAVAGGYWLLLTPLAAGETHALEFGGGVSAFDYRVNVLANITAVPEPSTLALASLPLSAIGFLASRRRR